MASRQIISLIALGALFWYAALLVIRFAGPFGLVSGGLVTSTLYITTPLAAIGLLWLVKRIIGSQDVLKVAVVLCITGLLLDGLAIRWAPHWYGTGDPVLGGAAWLLWGVGCILTVALLWQKPKPDI